MKATSLAAEFAFARTLLGEIAFDTESVFALCNADGRLIAIDGPFTPLAHAADIGFAVGVTLSAGTPRPGQQYRRTRFQSRYHLNTDHVPGAWFYDAAPICDGNTGAVVGTVILASSTPHSHRKTIQLLRACASAMAGHLAIESLLADA